MEFTPPPGYSDLTKLADGGFAHVWAATAPGDLRVAIKTPQRTGEHDRQRFEREVRLQSALEHPNVVEIFDYDLSASIPWCAMPMAEGNLWAAIQDKTFSTGSLIRFFDQSMQGVKYAHENHILHRDLKPTNILIFRDKHGLTAEIADFGLSRRFTRHAESFNTATHEAFGTDYFTAPEQWSDFRDVDITADIFSLGRILEAMLTVRGDLQTEHAGLTRCVRHSTRQEPNERYESVDLFLDEFRLLTEPRAHFRGPVDRARVALRELLLSPTDPGKLNSLLRVLEDYSGDFTVLRSLLARIPRDILDRLTEKYPARFRDILRALVGSMSEPAPVDAALRVADTLDHCLDVSLDAESRGLCLFGLIALAATYMMPQFTSLALHRVYAEDQPEAIAELALALSRSEREHEWLLALADQRLLPEALLRRKDR